MILLFLVTAVRFFLGTATLAQTTFGSITGTVTDASGLPVPGADIVGKATSSGYVYQAKTNESGIFTLPNLREGSYDVSVTASGFQESRASGIKLASREIRRLDFNLQIGSVSTEIAVKGTRSQVGESESVRIRQ